MRTPLLILTVGFVLLWSPQAVLAQEASEPQTHAQRGLIIGALAGGISGGLALGVLGSGLCESDCDHAFLEAMAWGLAGGGVLGGVTGLILGSSVQRGPGEGTGAAEGPWSLRLAGGPRWAGPSELEGLGFWFSVSALRATTQRVSWGVEGAYLGGAEEEVLFRVPERDGGINALRYRWKRRLWNFSFVATRSLGSHPYLGPYLLADAGVYPLSESLRSDGTSVSGDPNDPSRRSESSMDPLPGFGIGGGGRWALGPGGGLGVEGRIRLVLGAGDDAALPLYSLGCTLLF